MESHGGKEDETLAERLNSNLQGDLLKDQETDTEATVRTHENEVRSPESVSSLNHFQNDRSNNECDVQTLSGEMEDFIVQDCLTNDRNSEEKSEANGKCETEFDSKSEILTNKNIENECNTSKTCDTFVDSKEELADDESEESGSEDEYESAEEGEELQTDTQTLREQEELLTDEEKEEKRKCGQALKEEGNDYFRSGSYKTAIKTYSQALRTCPLKFQKDRAIMYSNRAACKMKLESYESAIKDCSKAVELHPLYLKALMRRAELYEKIEKLDEALADYQKIVEMDPTQHSARAACARLPDMIKERNEKLKEEMMSKLKDLGNMVLRPFGLSTENFKLNQDPNSGGYSVNFVQNPSQDT